MGMNSDAIERFLADHDGIITTAQARTLGLSQRQIHYRIKSGRWQAMSRGVHLSAQHHLTEPARVRLAVAAHGAVADRTAAAFWHGLIDELPPVVTVSAPRNAHAKTSSPVSVSVMRRTFPAEDVEELRGISVTRRPLTVLTAAQEVDDGAALIDRALQKGEVTTESLTASLKRNSGAHGMGVARELLDVLASDSESAAERAFVELLQLHQITGWVQQYRLGNRRLDFAWPAKRVAVEINGWAFHRSHSRFQADGDKAATLAAIGWLLLPFSWQAINDDAEASIAKLASALSSRS